MMACIVGVILVQCAIANFIFSSISSAISSSLVTVPGLPGCMLLGSARAQGRGKWALGTAKARAVTPHQAPTPPASRSPPASQSPPTFHSPPAGLAGFKAVWIEEIESGESSS